MVLASHAFLLCIRSMLYTLDSIIVYVLMWIPIQLPMLYGILTLLYGILTLLYVVS